MDVACATAAPRRHAPRLSRRDDHRRRLANRVALAFLPLAVVATGLAGTVYLVAQQSLRSAVGGRPWVQPAASR